MIIEQVEALKTWLTTKLSPICDAEPSALAKYVCALVKKDKSEEDLRDICLDQLDVFLQLKTKPFVDELFETLKSKSYIPVEEKKPQAVPAARVDGKRPLNQARDKDEPPKKKASEVSSAASDKENMSVKEPKDKESAGDASNVAPRDSKDTLRDVKEPKDVVRENREPRALSKEKRDREGERDRRDSWKDERNRDGIRDARDIIREREGRDTREVREPRDRELRDRDRDYRRRRTRSRSYSPRRNYTNTDDRIRRRFDDRYRYSPDRRWARRRSWSRSPRRNRSPIGRPRSRSPRLRSRSPRLRSRSPRDRYRSFRSRSRSRSRSPRARSWSRPGSGGGFARSRSPQARQPDSRSSTPILDNDYSALISSSTNELPSVSSTVGTHPHGEGRPDNQRPLLPAGQGTRSRCIDFEEKGFCMMGDMCPFDHGTDPVVVEDVPIPNVVPGAAPPPGAVPASGPGFVPPDLRVPPPVHMGVRMNLRRHPPPNMVEPYMPEAPGLRGPPPHQFLRGMPPRLHPPPPGMLINRPPMERILPPQLPPHREVMIQQPPPVEDDDDLDPLIGDKEPSRIVIPTKRQYNAVEEDPVMMVPQQMAPPPPRMPHINQHHHMFGQNQAARLPFPSQPQIAGPPRKSFDFNRLGGRGGQRQNFNRPAFKTGNLTLEVRKIPAEMNNIAKINEHFGKFGNLTNIQVKYQGDASAALITFSNNGEATAAYKSPEPVFNNRFIKLFWHNPAKSSEDGAGASREKEVHVQEANQFVQRPAGGRIGDGIDHPSLVLPVRNNIPPAHKLFLDKTKSSQPSAVDNTPASEAAKAVDKSSIVYTSSVGHLKKTVFNPAAAGASKAKSNAVTSPTVMSKPSDFVSRIEAIKRAEENRKVATVKQAELDAKKQELLAKQIQQQKLLIETLDKKKATMSEEEKASLLKALKTISDAIDKVKYASGAPKKTTFQAPTPSQMKFVSQDMPPAPAPAFSYGRGRGWATSQGSSWSFRGRGRGAAAAVGRTHLDNRPKTIEVKDFELDELEEVKLNFQKFGEFEKVELMESIPSIFITYSARSSAEMAVAQGRKFKTKILTVRWNQMIQKLSRTESVQSSELDDEDLSVTLGSIEEEALRNIGAEKPEGPPITSSQSSKEIVTSVASTGDSRSVLELSQEADGSTSPAGYKRTLSEDLLLGDEHNFKASYTDDEDDEDHITVTLSTTVTNPSWVYAGNNIEGQQQQEEDLSADLDKLAATEGEFSGEDGWTQ